MKVLFLSNLYPPSGRGGYEQLCQEVAAGLRDRGHIVSVVTSGDADVSAGADPDGVFRVLPTEVDYRPVRGLVTYLLGQSRRLRQACAAFCQVLRDVRPDVLVAWGMWNLHRQLLDLVRSDGAIPLAYYVADYWPTLPSAWSLHWREPARRPPLTLVKSAIAALGSLTNGAHGHTGSVRLEHVMCVSDYVRRSLIEQGVSLADARVIYNGIDLDAFSDLRGRRMDPASGSGLKLLWAGRLCEEKDTRTAIEAMSYLSDLDIELIVAGQGDRDYVRELRALSRRLGVDSRVRFTGYLERDALAGLVGDCDILLFTSTWPEPLPRVVQEAMAAGLVTIGTTVGGMPEILEHEVNGLVFAAGDGHDLARGIRRLAGDATLCAKLSEAAHRTVTERFNIRRTIDEIEAYLQGAVDGAA